MSPTADNFRVWFGVGSLVFRLREPTHLELALVLEVDALDVADQPAMEDGSMFTMNLQL